MKSQYLGIAALVLALLVVCLPASEAMASSDEATVSLNLERASAVVPAPVRGEVVMGTQGDNTGGGDDNEGDPDEWGEGNGISVYGSPKPLHRGDGILSQGLLDLRGWWSKVLGVLSQWSR
jgi:hypothetical protein